MYRSKNNRTLYLLLALQLVLFPNASANENTPQNKKNHTEVEASLTEVSKVDTAPENTNEYFIDSKTIEWLRNASKPYRDKKIVLRGVFESIDGPVFIRDVLAPRFEEITGIKVEISLDEAYFSNWDKYFTEDYDITHLEQDLIINYKNLLDIELLLENHPTLNIPSFNLQHFTPTSIKGMRLDRDGRSQLLGIPFESMPKIYIYRKDLFEKSEIRDAFYQQYGYILNPAKTRKEYLDIARFFSEYGRKHNLDLHGTIVTTSDRNLSGAYEWILDVLPAFGVYHWGLDPKTFRATVAHGGALNSNEAKLAFHHWLELIKNSPPGGENSDWSQKQELMMSGKAAQTIMYMVMIRPVIESLKNSDIKGSIGFALNPITPEAYDLVSTGKGYIGYDDLTGIGINRNSANQEAALLFVQFVGLKYHQSKMAIDTLSTTHLSVFSDAKVQKMEQEYGNIFSVQRNYSHYYRANTPYLFNQEVLTVMSLYIQRIITNELSVSEGLDKMAIAVENRIEELGYYTKSE
jgi:multiple sugar transport system substrate-binding protein